ncbi:MAG: hypothetical protein ABII07_01930 [Patescibacteria group bacterium]|nr:hypothetical protein [Patescibacteria group bacterium]
MSTETPNRFARPVLIALAALASAGLAGCDNLTNGFDNLSAELRGDPHLRETTNTLSPYCQEQGMEVYTWGGKKWMGYPLSPGIASQEDIDRCYNEFLGVDCPTERELATNLPADEELLAASTCDCFEVQGETLCSIDHLELFGILNEESEELGLEELRETTSEECKRVLQDAIDTKFWTIMDIDCNSQGEPEIMEWVLEPQFPSEEAAG